MSYRDLEARLSCKIDEMRKRKRARSPMKIWRNIEKGRMLAMDPSSRETQDLIFLFKSVWVEIFLVGVGEAAGGADWVAGKGRNAADVSR
jgi:hypothetical protein